VEPEVGQARVGTAIAVFAETVLETVDADKGTDRLELALALVETDTGTSVIILAPHTLELYKGRLRAPFM